MCSYITGAREQIIMKVRVRKKVSILLKAPEAPLFKFLTRKSKSLLTIVKKI